MTSNNVRQTDVVVALTSELVNQSATRAAAARDVYGGGLLSC